ncbi:MAG: 50S ribosomal protein L11 methyltransferase, partial [Pseudomonadales bacterium]
GGARVPSGNIRRRQCSIIRNAKLYHNTLELGAAMAIYSLEMFGRMFADQARHNAYDRAIRQSVKEGDVVLDIGTGIGVYAMHAAKLGARKVFAVEINPSVQMGKALAEANGLADRIEFIEALSTEIELPEPANVIISDLRGVLPYYGQHFASVRDARTRHLAPGGVVMPTRDRIFAALSSNPSGAAHYRDIWLNNPFGLDLSQVATEHANDMRRDRVSPSKLISDPFEIAQIDYAKPDSGTRLKFEGHIPASKEGIVHGLNLWFEATVVEGISYSTGPFVPETVYGMAFLPFAEPATLAAGSRVTVKISAVLAGEDYTWSWSASAKDSQGKAWQVEQTNFRSAPLDIDKISRRKASYRPSSSSIMAVDALSIELLQKGRSLGEIADALVSAYPDFATNRSTALTHVADLVQRYDR